MAENNKMLLNVGGEFYAVHYDALNESTYLRNLKENIPQPDCVRAVYEGTIRYFIDRDPRIFCDILHYLKTWEVCSNDEAYLKILQNEAKFYGISNLYKKIQQILTNSIMADQLVQKTYYSKDPNYLEVNFNTDKLGSSASQILVQAFRYNSSKDNHSESRWVLEDLNAGY